MAGVSDIRSTFLDYFKKQGHEIVPSSPLVPRNDPTLMFTNAGMVQFKDVFTGRETRAIPRAASSQKCVRAGGKHNDLDNVGYTARHHTFFEMLGNFSFGDYFKDEAIALAWGLITKDFGIDKKRLVVTVYHDDDEAFSIWKKVSGFSDSKIIRISTSDNFWQMGDTGPCGPCSEIFFDHGDKIPGGPPGSENADGDRFIEIWNLVFMQFDQRAPLPKPSIDTGMGLERIAAVLQGKHDNYEIDLFAALIAASVAAIGVEAKGEAAASHKVIADHLRASSFLIADGVLPSNEGRGYVLRRIMRRAMRHAHILGARDPVMYRLFPALARQMGEAYPELVRAEALITETLRLEETKFKKTLDNGLKLLAEGSSGMKKGAVFPGEVAFKLYDTYGFPLDLTEDALRPRGITVDTGAFQAAMQKQKSAAKAAWKGSGEAATEGVWFEIKERTGATEFLGYETTTADGQVLAIVKDGKEVTEATAGDVCAVVVNQTPFYGESGGQIGDTGTISADGGKGAEAIAFAVLDTQKKVGDLFVHFGEVRGGTLRVGEHVHLAVDATRRDKVRANHSATHLLHEALRQVLGTHVAQKGSLVAPERLRFDFSHTKPMSADEIKSVEDIANAVLLENGPVVTRLMALDEARESGAMALFGEKYGDEVRVVSMGDGKDASRPNKAWSIELCGGTHVKRTGDIGLIKVVAEAGTSAGVRRVEALTGDAARIYLAEQDQRVRDAAAILKTRPDDLIERVKALMEERKSLERQLADAKRQLALGGGGSGREAAGDAIKTIGKVKLFARTVQGLDPKDLRGLVDDGKKQVGSGIVAVVGVTEDGKAGLAVGVTEDLVKSWNAVELAKAGAEALGGKGGGGRPDMAQAGGPDGAKAGDALKAIEARLSG